MQLVAMRRARPWPERPVSEANKSGNDTDAARPALTCSRALSEARDAGVGA